MGLEPVRVGSAGLVQIALAVDDAPGFRKLAARGQLARQSLRHPRRVDHARERRRGDELVERILVQVLLREHRLRPVGNDPIRIVERKAVARVEHLHRVVEPYAVLAHDTGANVRFFERVRDSIHRSNEAASPSRRNGSSPRFDSSHSALAQRTAPLASRTKVNDARSSS